jgi:hypothetical protein
MKYFEKMQIKPGSNLAIHTLFGFKQVRRKKIFNHMTIRVIYLSHCHQFASVIIICTLFQFQSTSNSLGQLEPNLAGMLILVIILN